MKYRQYLAYLTLATITLWLVSSGALLFASGNSQSASLPARLISAGTNKKAAVTLNAGISSAELEAADSVLSSHNIILLIDESGSMRTPDCPGGLSRWKWCALQSSDLARRLEPFTKDNLSVIPFATTYTVHQNCTVSMIEDIFNTESPHGGTDLIDPLIEQLAAYIGHPSPSRRPIVIAIITDGKPNKEDEIADAIITATHQMHKPSEISIVLLQVGNAFNGKRFLDNIDNHLVEKGAKYDIVSVRNFRDMLRIGLAQNLANAITEIEQPDKNPQH